MNRHSILVKTTLFFIVIFIAINVLLFFYHFFMQDKIVSLQGQRYIKALKVLRENKVITLEETKEKVKPYSLELITDIKLKSDVFVKGESLFKDKIISIYTYKDERYLSLEKLPVLLEFLEFKSSSDYEELVKKRKLDERTAFAMYLRKHKKTVKFSRPKPETLLFKDVSIEVHLLEKQKLYAYSFTVAVDLMLIAFYIFLYRKIKPLNSLKDNISKFAMGDLSIRTNMKGKDEIADVANEFDYAIARIKELTDSRNLFLRNIMHELKTPITKGKLIADTLDNDRKKQILQKAFYRLQYLLGEFAKIEELTSGNLKLKKHDFIVEELINQAMDILLIDDSKVDITITDKIVNVDFELFSIALKNLIDNSIKYNTNGNPQIIVTNESITIRNKGDKLTKDINEYFKPFNREYESIEKGLGLGLYITNSIIKIHGFKFHYLYKDEHHNFQIVF